jgi:hypothetical protein
VHDAGFVLSFVAVGGLMMFYPRLREMIAPVPESAAEGVVAEGWRRRAYRLAVLPAGRLLAASLAAWLVTTPLTVQYFNLFSPSGLLLNLIAIPLAAGVLFAGTMSIFTALLPAFISESFNHAAALLVAFLMRSVAAVDGWPGSHFYLPAPGPYWIGAWAVALVILFFGRAAARRRCALLLCCAGAWLARDAVRDRSVAGVVWSREETLQCFIDLPGGGDVLVDAGPSYRALEMIRGLRAQGVDRLEVVVLTRPLADSLGALVPLLREVPVGEIWCAAGPDRSPVARAAWAEAAQIGVPVRRFAAPVEGVWPGAVQWRATPDPATGALNFQVARGPGRLAWQVAGGAERPVRLELAEAPSRRGAGTGFIAVGPGMRALGARGLEDGRSLRWSFADDFTWRAGRPAVRVRIE